MSRSPGTSTAIVTGGASGIGRALCAELARSGVRVVVADRHADSAEQAAADIRGSGGMATAAELDVRDAGRFADLVRSTVADFGRLDYLFNNAGIVVGGDMQHFDPRHRGCLPRHDRTGIRTHREHGVPRRPHPLPPPGEPYGDEARGSHR